MISIIDLIRKKNYTELKALIESTPSLVDPSIELLPTVADHLFYFGKSKKPLTTLSLAFPKSSRRNVPGAKDQATENPARPKNALEIAVFEKDTVAIEIIAKAMLKHKFIFSEDITFKKSLEILNKIIVIYAEFKLSIKELMEQMIKELTDEYSSIVITCIQENNLELLKILLEYYPESRHEDLYQAISRMIQMDGMLEGSFDSFHIAFTFNEKACVLILNKIGGIQKLKTHPRSAGFLGVVLATEKYHIAEFFLKLGYDLHDVAVYEPERKTYIELILQAANSFEPDEDKSIQFLKKYVNIFKPEVWKNFSLTGLALGGKWAQIKFMIKHLGRDPAEVDGTGQNLYDFLCGQLKNKGNSNGKTLGVTRSHLNNFTSFSFIEKTLESLGWDLFNTTPKLQQAKIEPKLLDHPIFHVFDDDKASKELEKLVEAESEFWRLKLEDVVKDAATNAQLDNKAKDELVRREYNDISSSTVLHHNAVLWSLAHREQRRYLNQRVQAKLNGFKGKDVAEPKVLKEMEKITLVSAGTEPFVEVSFPDGSKNTVLKFMNFTAEDDYRFMVHTTCTKPDVLAKTLKSGADFIRSTQFFSCSLVDKETTAAFMQHQDDLPDGQGKIIFPIFLILDLADDAVRYAFSMDAWSPMLSRIDAATRSAEAEKYLKHLDKMKKAFSAIEWALRSKTSHARLNEAQERSMNLSIYDSDRLLHAMNKASIFKKPNEEQFGYCPDLTPRQTLKFTQNSFNEVVVIGKPGNKIVGILVEEYALNVFINQLKKMKGERLEQSLQSLRLLAEYSANYPLILIRTKPYTKDAKLSSYQKYKDIERQAKDCIGYAKMFMAHKLKIENSVFAKKKPSVVDDVTQCLNACLGDIERFRTELADIYAQIKPRKHLKL